MSHATDTIAALATPPGRGGIAVVRVSGPLVSLIIEKMLQVELKPRQATYLPFTTIASEIIDEGIAIFFQLPASFTGEDVLELHCHGGPVVVDMLLQSILNLGVRLARPGEFSERAFLNGKIDLTQAEAIADLINASSQKAAQCALRSLQGEFSQEIKKLNEAIIQLRMYIEAAIDFPTEEIDFLNDEHLQQRFTKLLKTLTEIQAQAKQGSFLREGIVVVIIGKPNVGKSSLLNCFSGKESAIVTDVPGTTRDVLREDISLDGIPVRVIDTAGLRDSEDVIEQEGIRRAYQEMKQADLVLYMFDAAKETFSLEDLPRAFSQYPLIAIRNKIDLLEESPSVQVAEHIVISISVKLKAGMDLLKEEIKKLIGFQPGESIFMARRRHLDALMRANQHLFIGLEQLQVNRAAELVAEELRQAHHALCEITGEFTTDDLLGLIFSNFCIGK